MRVDPRLLSLLDEAEDARHIFLARHLCERILEGNPDHGPTLNRYADCLNGLSLYDQSAAVVDHAEKIVPKNWLHLVFIQRGHRLKNMGDYAGAETQYLVAHDMAPGEAYLIFAASAAFCRGDIQRAEELARKATECPEGCIDEAYSNLGGYLLAQQRYEEARDCHLKALEITPDYRPAIRKIAELELIQSQLDGENSSSILFSNNNP